MSRISASMKGAPGSLLIPSSVRGHSEEMVAVSQEAAGTLMLDFPTFRTVGNKWVVKAPFPAPNPDYMLR